MFVNNVEVSTYRISDISYRHQVYIELVSPSIPLHTPPPPSSRVLFFVHFLHESFGGSNVKIMYAVYRCPPVRPWCGVPKWYDRLLG